MSESLRLGDEIGAGALATVVRVESPNGEAFAGKLLHTARDADEGAVERFAREAEVVRDVDHPNVVRVHGRRTIGGRDVILMELVDGPSLATVIARDAPLPSRRLVDLARGIAAGLVAAHDAGVIHRDLKPANVLVADGDTPKIADFGMARASSFIGVDPTAFTVLGTPDYMAPESLDPLAVDARTDLYALGCMMFEMATGRPPFSGATAFGVLEQHRLAVTPNITSDAGYAPALVALVHRLLEKNPADRPQSASAVVHELDRISADPTALAPTEHAALPTLDRGRCARCSTPLVTALDVCLSCRLPAPRLTRGNHTVFILGPGQLADKLDAGLRGKLLDWIEGSPSLNVDATRLSAKIPRLPFALATGVSEASGRAVVSSLAALGIEARAIEGGLRSLPEVRKKARMVGWRVFAIIAASSASMGFVVGKATLLWLFYPLLWVLVPTIVAANTFRPAARMRGEAKELPEPLASRLRNVARVGVELEARRHREALRGVVSRAMELREAAAPEDRDRTDAEVAQALDVAMVAAGRLDELDRRLERVDLREASAEVHTLMHERDTWSARLLDLTATLESFRARLAAAAAQVRPDEVEALDELRAKVEALEEVQTT